MYHSLIFIFIYTSYASHGPGARLADVDAHGRLNAVVVILPAVPGCAQHRAARWRRSCDGQNIDIEHWVTSNASAVGVPAPAGADAPVVARLRAAGAHLVCKTNMLEYAAGSVSPAFGQPRHATATTVANALHGRAEPPATAR